MKENKDKKSMRAILQDVSRVTGVPKVLILSRVRKQKVADARMLFCHIARKEGYLLREIASFIGKSYSRVSMACCDVVLRKETFRPFIDKLSPSVKTLSDTRKRKCVLTLKEGEHEWSLKAYQSPVGIRHEGKRPNMVIIDCYQEYNQEQLLEFSRYLGTIAKAMAFSNPAIIAIENSSKDVYDSNNTKDNENN